MKKSKPKYTVKKFEGDDHYSWAVFKDLPNVGRVPFITRDIAQPIVSGMDRASALHEKRHLESKA